MNSAKHDAEIREQLFEYLEQTYGRVRIIEEKTIGRSRADIVMVTRDTLFGIEIKSDADTYARLATQVGDYDRYFRYNLVAVGSSHAMHIEEHIPSYWGIITVEENDGSLDFYPLRRPEVNPHADIRNRLAILWRPELAVIQQAAGLPALRDKSKAHVIRRIVSGIPSRYDEKTLDRQIAAILMERDYTTVREDLAEFRKGTLQKAIEQETDPQKQMELMMKKEKLAQNFKKKKKRKRSKGFM